MKKSKLKLINATFLILGLALFGLLLFELDFREIGRRLAAVGWVFLLSVGLHTAALVSSAAAWKAVIHPDRSRASYKDLLSAFWFGHVINYMTPGGTMGEVLRGTVLREKIETDELVASIISYNFYNTATMGLFALIGPILCLLFLDLPRDVILTIFAVALLALIPMILIFICLRLGAVRQLARLVGRLPFVKKKYQQILMDKAAAIDGCIADFINRPRDFRNAVLWMFAARIVQPLEVWALLHVFLPQVGLWHLLIIAFITQTTSQLLSWVISIVPGQIGFAEGGMTLLFKLIGLDPLAGFSMELVRRLRMIVTVAIGLVIGFFVVRGRRSAPQENGS